jgi:hypothetical protein
MVALAAMGSRGAAATCLAAEDGGGQCSVGGVVGHGAHLGEIDTREGRKGNEAGRGRRYREEKGG